MNTQDVKRGATERTDSADQGEDISPLAGIRVLDFSHILAGPYCTRLLADLGAEIVKVESRTRPDLTGALRPDDKTPGRQDRPPLYLNTNRSKRSVTLNLKTEAGRNIATQLAAKADVIVENFSSGVMGRLGLDYERLSAINPGLIFLSLSGYGHTGPRKHWTSMNMNLQAHSGLMLATGSEGDPPVSISNSWNDYIGGIHGSFAVIEALTERRKTGNGTALDISQFECSVATIGGLLMAGSVSKRPTERRGSRCSTSAPQGVYRCGGTDDWCTIAVQNDEQWLALIKLVDDPRLSDERYLTAQERLHASDQIDVVLEEWTQTRDSQEVERILNEAGIAVTRMHRIADVMELKEAEAVFQELEDPREELRRRVTGLPISWDGLASALRPAPELGGHTVAVLQEWLGLTSSQVDELEREGALE